MLYLATHTTFLSPGSNSDERPCIGLVFRVRFYRVAVSLSDKTGKKYNFVRVGQFDIGRCLLAPPKFCTVFAPLTTCTVSMRFLLYSPLVPFASFLLLSVLVLGCDSDDGLSGPDPNPPTGVVEGTVTAADGITPIQGVTVGLAREATASEASAHAASRSLETVLPPSFAIQMDGPTTTTNAEGFFSLEDVPTGEHTFTAKRGVFEATFTATVTEDDVVAVDEIDLESVQPLGYVQGEYDAIEEVILSLGNDDVDKLDPEALDDRDLLDDYAIVFINCGSDSFTEDRAAVLNDYVNDGGTLYLSDKEAPYVEALFPDDIAFSDESVAEEIEGQITSSSLQDWIRLNALTLTYDAGFWERIVRLEGDADVLVRGQPNQLNEGDEPLAITFDVGSGRVVYTTFHNTVGQNVEQESVLRYYIYLDS